ncbi:unnamed protein product [Rotaria sp. Silwood1]|nr:unnamed protein product [Rotaria sp. Silwood1]CAF1451008.1 unnamed protein product [Rotaria sp. Silwood1]CAF3659098.1 unnamed protein product [Rotaria sp. Silwood1]CAF4886215.1 unnamed protein product [Rotaria sp. Silwood1]
MSQISTFDHLPNELIIYIFSYLKSNESFYAFFYYNDRLRKLVKRHVIYSRRELKKDITRFSTLHSWYKHLDYMNDGTKFYLIPMKGEQARYSFDPRISDYSGIHWHFWTASGLLNDQRIQEIIRKYPVRLNLSFCPSMDKYKLPRMGSGFQDFVRRHYPSQWNALETTFFNESDKKIYTDAVKIHLQYIHDNEPKRLEKIILEAADNIWKELQELEDVNILEIEDKE